MSLKSISALILAGLVLLPRLGQAQDSSEASPSNWLNPDGKAVAAEFVRLGEDSVVLRLTANGKEVTVPFSALSLESHLQALKLADPEAFSKPLKKTPEKVVVEDFVPEASAFADVDLLTSPFNSGTSLEQYMDTITSELERGNALILWHTMPPKMQGDMEDVMVKAVGALGAGPINQIRSILKSINVVIHEKKEFIFGYPLVASQPEIVAQLESQWPKLAGLSTQLSMESRWQVENFQKGQILPWIASFVTDLAPYAQAIQDDVEQATGAEAGKLSYTILSQSANRAKVEVAVPGQPPQTLDLQKVGDIWLVPSVMNDLRKGLDAASKQLDASPNTSALTFVMMGISAAVGELERASTQAEFDAAVNKILGMVQGMSPAGGMNGGPAGGPQGGPMGAPMGGPSDGPMGAPMLGPSAGAGPTGAPAGAPGLPQSDGPGSLGVGT